MFLSPVPGACEAQCLSENSDYHEPVAGKTQEGDYGGFYDMIYLVSIHFS